MCATIYKLALKISIKLNKSIHFTLTAAAKKEMEIVEIAVDREQTITCPMVENDDITKFYWLKVITYCICAIFLYILVEIVKRHLVFK